MLNSHRAFGEGSCRPPDPAVFGHAKRTIASGESGGGEARSAPLHCFARTAVLPILPSGPLFESRLYYLYENLLALVCCHRAGDAGDIRYLRGQGPSGPRDRGRHLRLFSGLPGSCAVTAEAIRAP